MKSLPAALLLLAIFLPLWLLKPLDEKKTFARDQPPIPAQFEDKSLFLSPIKQLKSNPGEGLVTGITVPHHLLARDLIARAFNYASRGRYDRILLLSPDHFNLGDSNISTTTRDFSTV